MSSSSSSIKEDPEFRATSLDLLGLQKIHQLYIQSHDMSVCGKALALLMRTFSFIANDKDRLNEYKSNFVKQLFNNMREHVSKLNITLNLEAGNNENAA